MPCNRLVEDAGGPTSCSPGSMKGQKGWPKSISPIVHGRS